MSKLLEITKSILDNLEDRFEVELNIPNHSISPKFVFKRYATKDYTGRMTPEIRKDDTVATRYAYMLVLATYSIDGEVINLDDTLEIDGQQVDYFSFLYDFYSSLPPEYISSLAFEYQRYITPSDVSNYGEPVYVRIINKANNNVEEKDESFTEPNINLVPVEENNTTEG